MRFKFKNELNTFSRLENKKNMNEHLINVRDRVDENNENNENNTIVHRPYLEGYERPYMEPNREECVICIDNDAFTYRSWVKLGCQHYFHRHCIDIWMIQRPMCPLCNGNIYDTHRNRSYNGWKLMTIIIIGIITTIIIIGIIIYSNL